MTKICTNPQCEHIKFPDHHKVCPYCKAPPQFVYLEMELGDLAKQTLDKIRSQPDLLNAVLVQYVVDHPYQRIEINLYAAGEKRLEIIQLFPIPRYTLTNFVRSIDDYLFGARDPEHLAERYRAIDGEIESVYAMMDWLL